MMTLLVLVLLRLLLRKSWLAVAVFFVAFTVLPTLGSEHFALDLGVRFFTMGLLLFVALRIGLLALVGMQLFRWAAEEITSLDPGSWVATTSMINLAVLVILAVVAALIALGGRALLQDEI
jgi:hypothetical protein